MYILELQAEIRRLLAAALTADAAHTAELQERDVLQAGADEQIERLLKQDALNVAQIGNLEGKRCATGT